MPHVPASTPCPDPGTLNKLLRDELVGEEARYIEDHVGSCSRCQFLLRQQVGSLPRTIAAVPASVLPSGDAPTVPGYEIHGVLGEGAMGVVYRAVQTTVGRTVALKVLRAGLASQTAAARFRAEAEAAARLTHPGIVSVYEFGECAGGPYLTLEFCDGGSLADKLDGTPWHATAAARLVEMLADAVAAAHAHGIVHRDLKPANVLLTRSAGPGGGTVTDPAPAPLLYAGLRVPHGAVPKVTDFGISKRLDSPDGPTATGVVVGTPSYMSPEQAGGESKHVGPTADVYALGAVLYELLTGRPPFRAASVIETLDLVRNQDPVPVRALNPHCPRDLETVCLKCLEKAPARRYAHAVDLADDLRRFQEGRPVLARPVGTAGQFAKWVRRNKGLSAGLAAATVFLVAGAVVSTLYGVESAHQAKAAKDSADVADARAEDAKKARKEAENDRDTAKRQRAIADEQREQMRGMVYAARLDELQAVLRENRFERVREILKETAPGPGEPDLRGWEWRYFDRLMDPAVITFPLPDAEGYSRAVAVPRSLGGSGAAAADYAGVMGLSANGRELVLERVVPGGRVFDLWDLLAGKRLATYPPTPIAIPDPESQVPKQPRPIGSPPTDYQKPPFLSEDMRFVAVPMRVGEKQVVRVLNLRTGEQIAELDVALGLGDSLLAIGPNADWLAWVTRPPFDPATRTVPAPVFSRWSRVTGKISTWNVTDSPLKREGQPEFVRELTTARVGSDGTTVTLATRYRQLAGTEPEVGDKHVERFEHCEDEWDVSADPPRHVRHTRVPVAVPFDLKTVRRDHEAAVSRNHKWFAYLSESKLQVFSAADNKLAWERPVDFVTPFRFGDMWRAEVADDGSRVAVLGPPHVFLVFHRPDVPGAPGLLGVYPTRGLRREHARFSPDGSRLVHVSLHPEPQVTVWDVSKPPEFETLHPTAPVARQSRTLLAQDGRVEIELPVRPAARPNEVELTVLRDAKTRQEIARIPGNFGSPFKAPGPTLTANGTRLFCPHRKADRGAVVWDLYDTATGNKVGGGTLELRPDQRGWVRPCGNWLCEHVTTFAMKPDPKTGAPVFDVEPWPEPLPPTVAKKEPRAGRPRVLKSETRFRDLATGAPVRLHDDAEQLPIDLGTGERVDTDDLLTYSPSPHPHTWRADRPILVLVESDHPTPKYSRPDPENPAERPAYRQHGLKAYDPVSGKLLWANLNVHRSPLDRAATFHWQPVERLFTDPQVLSPDGHRLVLAGFRTWGAPVAAVVFAPQDGSGLKVIPMPGEPTPAFPGAMFEGMTRFEFAQDSQRLALWNGTAQPQQRGHLLGVADPNTGAMLWHTGKVDGQVLEAHFSDDGKRLFTTEASESTPAKFRVWDPDTGRNLASLPIPPSSAPPTAPRETTLYSARFTVTGDIVRLPTSRGVRVFNGSPRP